MTYVAPAWIVAAAVNIAWPRHLTLQWYLNWGLIITSIAPGVIGVIMSARIFGRSPSPSDSDEAARAHRDTGDRIDV